MGKNKGQVVHIRSKKYVDPSTISTPPQLKTGTSIWVAIDFYGNLPKKKQTRQEQSEGVSLINKLAIRAAKKGIK